jgi:hypothetical protein
MYPKRRRVARPVVPGHLARVGGEHAEDDPHGGRLAGAVGTDEPGHAARLDVKRDPVECPAVAEGTAD